MWYNPENDPVNTKMCMLTGNNNQISHTCDVTILNVEEVPLD